jgi:hypothetical protein
MATTLSQIKQTLGKYVEPAGDFVASLNQVLSRIHNMGTYKSLTAQYSLPVVDGAITLPDEADSILHVMVDGHPNPVRSLWHDFEIAGTNQLNGPNWGVIDSGFWPTLRLIREPFTELHVVPSVLGTSSTPIDADEDELVEVVAVVADVEGGAKRLLSTLDNATKKLTFPEPVQNILEIRFGGLLRRYDLRLDSLDPESRIATVGPESGATHYRRFRVDRAQDDETVVHVLCKRAFLPVREDSDLVYVTNLGALKHGLLGRISDDSADLERAQYHWGQCMLLLEEEAASSKGAAVPRLNIDPFGIGMRGSNMRQML